MEEVDGNEVRAKGELFGSGSVGAPWVVVLKWAQMTPKLKLVDFMEELAKASGLLSQI